MAPLPGGPPPDPRANIPGTLRFEVRPDLALEVSGQAASATTSLLAGYTAQAVAALDRARLRTQAAQAEALAEGDRMRTALLRAVSHDLRTPLASIKASVSSLRQTDVHWSAEDEAELLANIEQNADRLDALVGNLLDMSRLQAGSLEPFLRATAVDEVAPVALRGLDDADHLLIVVPDDLPLVRADPGLLERVLANLFSNALRHSPPDLRPMLRAREDGDRVVLDVVDHGAGVPAELKERIFEPFARLDERSPGVGLGLAVAKGFAEAMGGTIVAVDTPGGGLTVRVTLPALVSGVRRHAWRRPVTRVLVIDDEPSILRALRINLTARNYEVSTASDGTSGLAAVSRERPDAVILDLGLPDMDGTEVIHGVRGWSDDADHRLVGVGRGAPEGRRARRRGRRLRHEAVRHGRTARPAPRGGPPGRPRPGRARRHDAATSRSTWPPSGSSGTRPTSGSRRPSGSSLRSWSATAAG